MKHFNIKIYYRYPCGSFDVFDLPISEDDAFPSKLRKLASSFGALFVTCEKYGCRQFLAE